MITSMTIFYNKSTLFLSFFGGGHKETQLSYSSTTGFLTVPDVSQQVHFSENVNCFPKETPIIGAPPKKVHHLLYSISYLYIYLINYDSQIVCKVGITPTLPEGFRNYLQHNHTKHSMDLYYSGKSVVYRSIQQTIIESSSV